jgi:hypothetical protein
MSRGEYDAILAILVMRGQSPTAEMVIRSLRVCSGGHLYVASWLRQAGYAWNKHRVNDMTLNQRLDYHGELSTQFPLRPLRVVYAASGTLPAASIVEDDRAVIEHKLYRTSVSSVEEGRYLIAILNSEAVRKRIERLQSEGQFGPRDFDKVVFTLPIPRYAANRPLHQALASASAKAERIAVGVDVEGKKFQAARHAIREALDVAAVAERIDELVDRLLIAADGARRA